MSLSDITRKAIRSDIRMRLDELDAGKFNNPEINDWINTAQFDIFQRLGSIIHHWYGTTQAFAAITQSAGTITAAALTGNYAANKIARMTKFVLDDNTKVPFIEYEKLDDLLGLSTFDAEYRISWYGENLFVFIGANATALSTDTPVLSFIRKPDEMAGDSNVWLVTPSSVANNDKIDINGIRLNAETGAASFGDLNYDISGGDAAGMTALAGTITNVFQGVSGVTAVDNTGTVTITGASSVTSSNATRLAISVTTSATMDLPTELYELLIQSVLVKATTKLKMTGQKQSLELSLANLYNETRAAYGAEIQINQLEAPIGVQNPISSK